MRCTSAGCLRKRIAVRDLFNYGIMMPGFLSFFFLPVHEPEQERHNEAEIERLLPALLRFRFPPDGTRATGTPGVPRSDTFRRPEACKIPRTHVRIGFSRKISPVSVDPLTLNYPPCVRVRARLAIATSRSARSGKQSRKMILHESDPNCRIFSRGASFTKEPILKIEKLLSSSWPNNIREIEASLFEIMIFRAWNRSAR